MQEWRWRGFKIVQSIVERLPRAWAYALAVFAARFAWWFSPLARPRLEYNLKVACPEANPAEIRRLSWLNFRNHAKAYADLMMLPRTRVVEMRPLMHVEGWEHLSGTATPERGLASASCLSTWRACAR